AGEKQAGRIHAHGSLPIRGGHVAKASTHASDGVVEQYVEPSVAGQQAIPQGDDAGFVAEVAAVAADGKAARRQLRGKPGTVPLVAGGGHYMRARLGESLNDMLAVDSSASCHQRYTALQAKQFRRHHARQSASMAATRRSVNSLTRTCL